MRTRGVIGLMVTVAGAATFAAATTRPPHLPALDLGLEGLSAGELLLGELNCISCHEASPAVLARLQPKPAPVLGHVTERLRPDFVRAWLRGPLATTPGTTMPDVLRWLPGREREATIEELNHYFWSLSSTRPPLAATPGSLQIQQGRVLYHQTGCVACHAPHESAAAVFGSAGGGPTEPDGARFVLDQLGRTSQPLPDLAAKYVPAGLAGFLRDPLAVRRGGRMPSLRLTDAEARAIAAYLQTRSAPPSSWVPGAAGVAVRPELARRGRDRFASLGCAGCHELGPGLPTVRPRLVAPSLAALDPNATAGCLTETPSASVPRYALSDAQRAALKAVLRDREQLSRQATASHRVLQGLARFNCHACHVRNGCGGPVASRSDYFTSLSESDLGDEGRLPPHVSGVGDKLRPDWLGEVLTNAGAVRPYLAVRMPQFGPANAGWLVGDLVAADAPPAARASAPPGDTVVGAELVGLEGYSCITCHSFGPHPSLGISVMDMTRMAGRLNWDWFRRYLLDPPALRPGTRMPAFWPEGEATVTSILEGDSARQIAAIWSYLSMGRDAPPPPGLLESLEKLRGAAPPRGD